MRTPKVAKSLASDTKLNPNNRLRVTTENPELADRFDQVLTEVVEAMTDEPGIRYAFIGGIASSGLGRPRSTHDIDIFVMPEDAELVLRALAKRGFRTEKTDPSWLYKAFKENILVDVIFKSKGEIYLDSEMHGRAITAEYHGKKLRLVAPEDLLIIKAAAHSELCPNHWHDATALLSHASLDWPYLIKRARRAPRRILSLLLYAQSNDIWVPNHVIHELYSGIFGEGSSGTQTSPKPMPRAKLSAVNAPSPLPQVAHPLPPHHEYTIGHLRECIAEDPRSNELDIQIEQAGNKILLRGEVGALERKEAVEQIAREHFPAAVIENQLRILSVQPSVETEEVP